MFIGRREYLADLETLWRKRTSSIVACRGRRRIGKSTLIREFARRMCTRARMGPSVPGRTATMKFARYLVAWNLEAAVEGFVQTAPSRSARMATIVARLRDVTALNPAPVPP